MTFIFRDGGAAQPSAPEKAAWDRHSHENGYNPHCVFLFFLENTGFDPSVLLDFLISSETCFLEYLVRYLKLLPEDWGAFLTACQLFDGAACAPRVNACGRASPPVPGPGGGRTGSWPLAALGGHGRAQARVSGASEAAPGPPPRVGVSPWGGPATPRTGSPVSPPAVAQGLVDYDTSDDSEVESADREQQTPGHPESRPGAPKEAAPPFPGGGEAGTLPRTLKCFRELQGAICRLQKRDLFPYNPAALLRLFSRVEAEGGPSTSPVCSGGVAVPDSGFGPSQGPGDKEVLRGVL